MLKTGRQTFRRQGRESGEGEERSIYGEMGYKRLKYDMYVPASSNKCKYHALQTHANKRKNMPDITPGPTFYKRWPFNENLIQIPLMRLIVLLIN